jgi:hypothetical protein
MNSCSFDLSKAPNLKLYTFHACAGDKIEKNEMGGACGAYGGGERCAQGVGGETWGKEDIGETQT